MLRIRCPRQFAKARQQPTFSEGTIAGTLITLCGYATNPPLKVRKIALTIKGIENAKQIGKPYKLSDGGGLCLLVTSSGARLWRWRYRFDGKEKMMALGEYPLVPLSRARELHLAARKKLAL